jgi:hypothetical protein
MSTRKLSEINLRTELLLPEIALTNSWMTLSIASTYYLQLTTNPHGFKIRQSLVIPSAAQILFVARCTLAPDTSFENLRSCQLQNQASQFQKTQ